jgi:hypothetical protein
MKKRILVVSTYPLKQPRHGGQKRLEAIVKAYEANFAEVRHSAVFFKGFYADYDPDDIPLGRAGEALVMQSPLTGDIVCGRAIYDDPSVKAKFTTLLKTLNPDIIHVEQPFPYLGLKPLLEELELNPGIIFGSQNVEAPMKRDILESANVPEKEISRIEKEISDLEEELSRASALVVACTATDLKSHAAMGAQKLVLAPNGIAPSRTDDKSLDHWRNYFKKRNIAKTALFVGSAHPPNWTGFLDMVGKGLGFVPADSRIVVAGSICDYFDREIKSSNLSIQDATFWLRAVSAGRLSEESLGALLNLSDVIILPITEGGGSNLKTAEAILANKKVITTSHGLRSFEWFKEFPNVWVADTAGEFRKSISEALDAKFQTRTEDQQKQAKQVEWNTCLADMVKEARGI